MFYYVKMVGDEPIIVERDSELLREDFQVKPEDLYFLVAVMMQDGNQGMAPVQATDNGLNDSEITIYGDTIAMIAKLEDESNIVKGIKHMLKQKSDIVAPGKPELVF